MLANYPRDERVAGESRQDIPRDRACHVDRRMEQLVRGDAYGRGQIEVWRLDEPLALDTHTVRLAEIQQQNPDGRLELLAR